MDVEIIIFPGTKVAAIVHPGSPAPEYDTEVKNHETRYIDSCSTSFNVSFKASSV